MAATKTPTKIAIIKIKLLSRTSKGARKNKAKERGRRDEEKPRQSQGDNDNKGCERLSKFRKGRMRSGSVHCLDC